MKLEHEHRLFDYVLRVPFWKPGSDDYQNLWWPLKNALDVGMKQVVEMETELVLD